MIDAYSYYLSTRVRGAGVDRFQELEADITRQTITVNPAEAELLDALFTPFVSGFDALMPEMKVEELRIETTQLLALAFNALRWSQQQILAGYYAPGITMARSAWECWLNGMYLNLYPEDLRSWKVYETRPKPFAMRKLVAERMEPDDDSERKAVLQAMNDLYQGKKGDRFSGYSVFSHPTWEAIRILVADDGAGLTLRIGPAYDKGSAPYGGGSLLHRRFVCSKPFWLFTRSRPNGLGDARSR